MEKLTAMARETFYTLSDERLGSACMEPTFMLIRGKSPEVKAAVISGLNNGQRALCMFRVMYDHSCHSSAEYYAWISYILDQPGYWKSVMEGLRFFGDIELMDLLEETRESLEARNHRLGLNWGDAVLKDVETDPGLGELTGSLFAEFQQTSSRSLRRMAVYIRSHPDEFVVFAD